MQDVFDLVQARNEKKAIKQIEFYCFLEKPLKVSDIIQLCALSKENGCLEVYKHLLQTWPFLSDVADDATFTPLHAAVMHDDPAAVQVQVKTDRQAYHCVNEEGLNPAQAAVVYEKVDALVALFTHSRKYSWCTVETCLDLIHLAHSCQSTRSIIALKDLITTHSSPYRTLLIRHAVKHNDIVSPSLLKLLCEMFPAEVDYCVDHSKTPMVLCAFTQPTQQKTFIAILHAYGSESHFNWSDDRCAPRSIDYPELSQFMRDLHFSRSLTEILFFALDSKKICSVQHTH